jgi:HEPN domain-containing protein
MKPLTVEWVAKAERDFQSAVRGIRARKDPNYDLCCFLAQQCAEKYLKAFLQETSIAFAKTHNLVNLLSLAGASQPSLALLQGQMLALNGYAVEFRYPGHTADKAIAQKAIKDCKQVREALRTALGLPV